MKTLFIAALTAIALTTIGRPGVISFTDPNAASQEASISLYIQEPGFIDSNQWTWIAGGSPGVTNVFFDSTNLIFRPTGDIPNPVLMNITIVGTNGQVVASSPITFDTNSFSTAIAPASGLSVKLF